MSAKKNLLFCIYRERDRLSEFHDHETSRHCFPGVGNRTKLVLRLSRGTLNRYSKALEYEYRVKTAALDILKRYSILSLTLYLE
jgi:hypothetical protein